jgi:hypothetical protein
MRKIAMAVACMAALLGTRALADDGEYLPEHQHQGFYFHLELGVGVMETKTGATSTTEDMSLSGAGGAFNLAVGYSVSDQLVLGLEVWDMLAMQPDVKVGGSSTSSDSDSEVTLEGWGPTVRFYIAPEHLNFFVAATPSITRVSTRLNGTEASTRTGFGGRFSAGKEWWLGHSQWGIGIAGHVVVSSNKDNGDHAPTWSTGGAGIDLSATWN